MAADGLSSVIASLLGGTGVANSSTITLGGAISTANSLTTSGNFPLTFTTTGSTNVTLPTSGTLATTTQLISTPVSAANGGTGVSNSSTITIGGAISTANSFTTSGNFPVTLTVTGSTNVTLPTSGTLGTGTIGGSTGAKDKAILSANGTGGSTLQATSLLFNANSQFVVPGGTSSLPSICISGSLTTGFYSDTANQIKVTTSGSQIATISAGGFQTFGSAGFTSAGVLNSQAGRVVVSRTVAGNITGASTDYILAVSSTASARTVTVPNSVNTNQVFIIKDTSGAAATNNITLTTPGGVKTFDGATSLTINTNYGVIRIYYDGSNYWTW